jgi:DNA-3-methyladenine glycosylase
MRVAKSLLGKYLIRKQGKRLLIGRIVEVEAYLGSSDPASHAYRGKTRRNEVMFYRGGHLYIYFTYGMHFCANVVTEGEEIGHAVLLRAVEPVSGIEAMKRRRAITNDARLRELTSGPAKVCQAFGLKRTHNGTDLCGKEIWIAERMDQRTSVRTGRSRRIGVTRGVHKLWRYFERGNPFVSRPEP